MANRRRNYVVHRPIQFGYAGLVIWLMFNLALVIGSVTYVTTMDAIVSELELVGAQNFNLYDALNRINGVLIYRVGILFLVLVVLSGLFEIYFLHRIVGPIYAIERNLTEAAQGQPFRPVVLRKKDYFRNLADLVNQAMTRRPPTGPATEALLTAAEAHPELAELAARAREERA